MDSGFRFYKYKQGEVLSQKIKPNKGNSADRYPPADFFVGHKENEDQKGKTKNVIPIS